MTQENKELLLKDLSARLPYGVKCSVYEDANVHTLSGVLPNKVYNELYFEELDFKECDGFADIQYCKPYLFPLSSMTEEERMEIGNECAYGQPHKAIDILHKRHIDYRGLIPMGLALDATGLNIY